MTMRSAIKSLIVVLCCSVLVAAKDTKAAATALVERNRSRTDIRSTGSPSFKLRAAFTYQAAGGKSAPVEGIYELHWASQQQWRETFQAGNTRVTRVFTQGALSRSNDGVFPAPDDEISDLFVPPIEVQPEYPAGIQKSSHGSAAVECVNMNYLPSACPSCGFAHGPVSRIACFDPATGLFLQLQVLGNWTKDDLWDYSDYRTFGEGKFVPQMLKRKTSEGDFIEAHLVELDTAAFPSTEFQPFPAPVPVVSCDTKAPRALRDPSPNYSQQALNGRREVHAVYRVLLASDGVPVSVSPGKSGGEIFDREAIQGLMRWRFAPATCKGQPVAVSISIEQSVSIQ
jgi:TonB family protein